MLLLLQNKGQFMNITTNCTEKGLKSFLNGLLKVSASFKNNALEFQHPWYISSHLAFAFHAFARSLESNLPELKALNHQNEPQPIALMLRNNAPLEGFDLLLQLLLTGNACQISIPNPQEDLLKLFLGLVNEHLPEVAAGVITINQRFSKVKGVVYAGPVMNETMRGYLNHKNLLILENVDHTAILTGEETGEIILLLARDISMHFGRAADSVKNLLVPEAYDFNPLLNALEVYAANRFHSRYFNHYEYQKAAMLINHVAHFDNGYVLICDDISYKGKISVVTYQKYSRTLNRGEDNRGDFGCGGTQFFRQNEVLSKWISDI
jgi:hypothetical protein